MSPSLFILYTAAYKSGIFEIVGVMSYYIVDIGIDQLCGKNISVGIQVAIKIKSLLEALVIFGAVFVKVDDVGVVKQLSRS